MMTKAVSSMNGFLMGVVVFCALGMQSAIAADGEFPGRALFLATKPVEIDALRQKFADVQLVDVRSRYEYETLHMKSAVHLPLYDDKFKNKVRALSQESGKPLVFYCNGRDCYKSYRASDKARVAGVKDTEVFDAGVLEWARTYPELTMLLGSELGDASKLISKEGFKRHLLSPEDFSKKVGADDAPMVLDIRSVKQRRSMGLFVFKEQHIPLENRASLDEFMVTVKQSGKPLLVYDMAGKQVRWFQYYLESKGIKDYYFMEGGVRAFLDKSKR